MRPLSLFGLLTLTLGLGGCAALSPAETAELERFAARGSAFERVQAATDDATSLPPSVVEALLWCTERAALDDLHLDVGEEQRLRRCLASQERSFMHATKRIVDWQVTWLKQELREHRGSVRVATR